jgi:competence protein ComGC
MHVWGLQAAAVRMILLLLTFAVLLTRAQLIPDALTEELQRKSGTPQTLAAVETVLKEHNKSHDDDYEFARLSEDHRAAHKEKQCPEGCEKHGNCNKALGR